MLATLSIKNLATVESLEVEFGPGLNTVTGETGAGKSVILGAVQTVLGERAEKSLIRHGAGSCEISAQFEFTDPDTSLFATVQDQIEAAGAPACEAGVMLIRRVLTPTSTRCYVNSTPVTLKVLKDLGDLLVDIHGPHDHQSLLSQRCQMDLLDAFACDAEDLAACGDAWNHLDEARRELTRLQEDGLSPSDCELLRHQLGEIDRAELDPSEERELQERHALLAHARRLIELAGGTANALSEADGSVVDMLAGPVRQIQELAGIAAAPGDGFVQRLEELIEGIRDLSLDLSSFAESLDLDPDEFARIEDRLGIIHDLKRRHRASVEELLTKADEIRLKLDAVENRDRLLSEAEANLKSKTAAHLTSCQSLSSVRGHAAERLASAISGKLSVLGFASGRFEVRLGPVDPGPTGSDRVEFMFAPNPGQDLMPLRKVASSGEMSRVMLAIKTVLVAADPVPLLIFDEVDANVGGRIARSVAAELASVGSRHQVLCITHLPQIAAVGNCHYLVGKNIEGDSTTTSMRRLGETERIDELVRMMGSTDSRSARAHAEEMLGEARQSGHQRSSASPSRQG